MLDLSRVDKNWTLFLDRDGVLNHEMEPYTLHKSKFVFYDGVLDALKIFDGIFRHIIIVTNQRGVGRKLMTETDLIDIHDFMRGEIIHSGGRIDDIYYCTSIDDDHPNRKPNPGMALEAMKKHPLILKEHSIMVGNNISDMQFGRNAGLHTVLLTTTGVSVELPNPLVDLQYGSLYEFAKALTESR